MLDRSIDHRPHAFGGAGVLIQEFRDTGEIDSFLALSVLQIVVALVVQRIVPRKRKKVSVGLLTSRCSTH
jgi:hypothetical protein